VDSGAGKEELKSGMAGCVIFAFSPATYRSLGIVAIVGLLLLLLSASRRREEPVPGQARPPAPDRKDSRYWKAGVLYVNPSDPAIFVRKRFGIGYTINFGHWVSWVVMAILLSIPFLARFLGARH
jgi:uncharacterized membrane protein